MVCLVQGGSQGRGLVTFLSSACCVGAAAAHLHAGHVRLPIRSSSGSHAFMTVGKFSLLNPYFIKNFIYERRKNYRAHAAEDELALSSLPSPQAPELGRVVYSRHTASGLDPQKGHKNYEGGC